MGTTTERDFTETELAARQKSATKQERKAKLASLAKGAVGPFAASPLWQLLLLAFAIKTAQIGLDSLVGAFLIMYGASLLPIRFEVKQK